MKSTIKQVVLSRISEPRKSSADANIFSSVADGLDKSSESVSDRFVVVQDRLAVIASTDNVIDHRDVAKWESALKELLDSYLVDQRDSKGQILVITDLGYRIADMIEI